MARLYPALAALCFLSMALPMEAGGQDGPSRRILPVAEIGLRPAYLLPTNKYFKGTEAKGKPAEAIFSAHLQYGFRFGPESSYGRRYPHAVQGIGISYNTFFNPSEIGNPVALYVFQTSRVASLAENLSLDYAWNFGISYGWKKYDPVTNPDNIVVGSKANAYINLGLQLDWRFAPDLDLKAGVGVSHYSNGNTGYPNAGVNTAGGSIGLAWDFGHGNRVPNAEREARFKPYLHYDLVLYGAKKKKGIIWEDGSASIIPGAFAVVGMNFSPMYNMNKYFRTGLSLDAQFDESANITDHVASTYSVDAKFHRPPFAEQFAVGISARAEIVMPVFSINVGVGRNILCKGADTDSFYQVFALKTSLTPDMFVHIGYQLYRFKNPNNLMVGLGYRFGARGRR